MRHWRADIAKPLKDMPLEKLSPLDYQIIRFNLGKGNHTIDMKIFEASNKKIADRVWKDTQDKREMKEEIKNMAQYINAILHPEPKPLNEMSALVDVSSSANLQFLDNLQKCKAIAKTSKEWLQYILKKIEE